MEEEKYILVVGGAGYIGSHVNCELARAGYKTIALDNLSRGHAASVTRGIFIKGDLQDASLLDDIFEEYAINAIMHFAALSDVRASIFDPASYYRQNVMATLTLLEAMVRHKVGKIIFSSSASIFGAPLSEKIDESHPSSPLSPYGNTKWIVEKMLADFEAAYGIAFCALRYFNAAGGDVHGEVKSYERPEHNLIPKLLRAIRSGKKEVTIYGSDYPTRDGTCVRDYIHVSDLATAHLLALEWLSRGKPSACYNLGNGQGFTVLEVITAIEEVTGYKLNIIKEGRREGDPPLLVADAAKAARELSWKPLYPDLMKIIKDAWENLT